VQQQFSAITKKNKSSVLATKHCAGKTSSHL